MPPAVRQPSYPKVTGSLPLRGGYVPPYYAHVLRGGVLVSTDLEKEADACQRKYGTLGVSVFVGRLGRLGRFWCEERGL